MSAADVDMKPQVQSAESAREGGASRRKGWLALLALILLLLLTCCCFGWSQLRKIPDVVGMTEQEARAALEEAGFEVEVVSADVAGSGDSDSGGTPGTVQSQSPGAGKRLAAGTTVTITVTPSSTSSGDGDGASSGDGSASGSSSDGSAGGTGSGLPSVEQPAASEDDGSGSGGTGSLSLSGSAPTGPVVPVAQNLTEAAARRVLEGAGYRMVVGGYGPTSAGIVEGNVYFQDPAPGTILSRGATITVWISTGAPHTDGYEGVPYPGPTNP